MPISIQVKNLRKTFDYFKKEPGLAGSFKSLFWREKLYNEALKGISFEIQEGELVGFLGPNGAGKTTTLKILSGILYPTGGEAVVIGHVPWKREPAYQKQFAIVMGQKNQLWWDLPAQESFTLNKEIYEIDTRVYKNNLDELIELFDIKELIDVPVRKLSMGQRMKCELAAALLHSPKVLFLDEPTIGLDIISQEKIRKYIEGYNRLKKTTVLLTSHYMRDVERLCKRVIVINNGVIIYDGLVEDLMNRYADYKTIRLRFSREYNENGLEKYGNVVERDGLNVVIKASKEDIAKHTAKILSEFPVEDLSVEDVEIEDVISKIFTG
ncbi:MAG: ABC transporter ATP-binding protein [Nitrospirae bacterium]|nr:ABC transporter ATP-binding protein [Nitrospirota bacterium]